jgi:Rrf2 family protein
MKLSPAAEFAIRGVSLLAQEYGQGPVTLDTICNARDLPKQYLVKIFASLARAELITPVRGKKGGYMLARPPREITLLNVVEAVEGPIFMNFCQHSPPKCERTHVCQIKPVWDRLQHAVRAELAGMTLADCAGDAPTEADEA